MASSLSRFDRATVIAMLASGLMIAQMVAGKTLRDSIFLSSFPASDLPLMTFVAAAFAIAASFAGSELTSRISPGLLVPGSFLLSGAIQVGEYFLYAGNTQAAAIAIFLHVFALNLLLTSSFWSLMTEHFDPRSAQKAFGRIAGMGTLGGILGGLLAERTVALGSVPLLILFAAGLHIACGFAMWIFTIKYPVAHVREHTPKPALTESLRKSPYLVQLASLVVTVSVAAGLLDFLLKSQATLSIGKGPELARFFAWFYTATSVVAVVVQTLATPAILSRLGPAIPVRSLPAAIVLGGAGLLLSFGFAGLTLLRGLEVVLRGSMFRSGYEMFYTPVAASEKRAVKGIIDVTGERLGDLLASGLIGLLLWLSAGQQSMLLASVLCAGGALLLARRLEDAYLKALEKSLARQARPLKTTEENPLSGISFVAGSDLLTGLPGQDAGQLEALMQPALRQLIELRSGNEGRIKNALLKMEKVDPLVCGQLIQLLANANCAFLAMEKLKAVASQHAGQLADALLDVREQNMIRRRVPLVMAASQSQLALDALTVALKDPVFQIRFRSAYAMRQILRERPALELQAERVWRVLSAELQVDRVEWEERRMSKNSSANQERPGDASVEYLFLLLRLLLPPEPVEMAYRALGTEDRHLRGTALEYLQTALPSATWKQIESLIADHLVKAKT